MKKLIIIIAAVVVLGVGAVLYFFVFADSEKPEVRVEYSPGEFFTSNTSDTARLFKASIILVVNEEGLDEMLAKENARIRDTIIFILRNLTEEEVRADGTQDELRDVIITALNERLGIDNFVEVLFNNFVIA